MNEFKLNMYFSILRDNIKTSFLHKNEAVVENKVALNFDTDLFYILAVYLKQF